MSFDFEKAGSGRPSGSEESFQSPTRGGNQPFTGGFDNLPEIRNEHSEYPMLSSENTDVSNIFSGTAGSTQRNRKNYRRTRSAGNLMGASNIPWRLILPVVAVAAAIVCLVVYKDVILDAIRSIVSAIVSLVVVVFILKTLLRR